MKYTVLLLSICLIAFAACNKDEKNEAPEYKNTTYVGRADDVILATDTFVVIPPLSAEGTATIYKNSLHQVLRFENFMVDNGPNLIVYLSKDPYDLADNVRIGDLQAASGNFNYVFSNNINVAEYKYVVVYGEDDNSTYTFADL